MDADKYTGRGLDPHAWVGDEGGALWAGLCKAKGKAVKNASVSDTFHFKQDVHRHEKFFKATSDKNRFKRLMEDAMDAPTSVQADLAEKGLDNLIKKSTDPKKMGNFKDWWWRRRVRWQRWCKTQSSSSASSAEVANAKSLSISGYRKRLLDVITFECSSAVLETAEIKRQKGGLKTVGRGPSYAERKEQEETTLLEETAASADAVEFIHHNADTVGELDTVNRAQHAFNINVRDPHRSDKTRRKQQDNVNTRNNSSSTCKVSKRNLRLFNKTVEGITMDILHYESGMTQFMFHVLDTMGYVQTVS